MGRTLILKIIGFVVLISVLVITEVYSRLYEQSTDTDTNIAVEANNTLATDNTHRATEQNNVSGTGTIRFLHFEGGFYGIVSDDGERYDPLNLSQEFQVDGLRVRFVATILHIATYHMWGTPVTIVHAEKLDEKPLEINPDSHNCSGDLDKLTTPYNNAVDGDWDTKLAWNTSLLGDFTIFVVENYSFPTSSTDLVWEFKAYHHREGSLVPTPMTIEFWNGSSWKEMYELDDEQHVNETFTETVNVPNEAFRNDKITIKTTIKYSSHVAGGIPPYPPEQLLHYVEYYEGKLSTGGNNNNVFPIDPLLLFILMITIAAIIGSVVFSVVGKKRRTSEKVVPSQNKTM